MTANTPAQIVGPIGGRIYITGISIDVPASATVTISQGLASDALTALLPVPTDMLTPANASEFAYYAVSARGNGLWITSTQNVSTPTVIQFYSDELISTLPTTATPTLNAPASGFAGETVSVTITNLASYAAGTTFGVSAAGEYAIAGSTISWRLPFGQASRSLSVRAQEPGKKLSLAASVSLTINTYAYPQTVPPTGGGVLPPPPGQTTTPTLNQSSVTGNTGTVQNLTITNYNAAFTYRLETTAGSAIRSGSSIAWTLPGSAGNATLTVYATESGKSESAGAACTATVNAVLALPTVVPASMTRVTRVYAFDRVVEGYTGNTVRLRRATDNVEQDFGLNALGYLDIPAIHTWRAGSAVNFVWFIDQEGSNVTHPNANLTYPQFMAADGSMSWLGTNRDENTGVLSLAPGTGAPGLRLDTALLRTTNSGLTTNNGVEFTYLYTCLDRVIGNIADAASLGGITTRQAIASYGTSADNRLLWQFNNGTSPERLSHQGAATGAGGAAVTFGTQTSLKIKRFAQRIVSFGVHPTMTASGALTGGPGQQYLYTRGQMAFNGSNAANIAGLPAMANGTMETCGEVFSTRAAARIILGAIIVSETLLPAERQLLQCRLNEYGQRHKTATLAQMESWWDERVDFRNVNIATGRVSGTQNKLLLDFNQAAGNNWNLQAVDPQSGFGGVECPVGQGTNPLNTFLATTNYFSDAREYTIAFLGRGYHNNINIWMSLHDPTITDSDARPVIYVGHDHTDAVFGASVSPTLDPDGISGDYGGGDGNLGTISQPMGKYGHKLSNRQWNSNNVTVTTAFTFKPEYGGQTFNVGDTLTVAQFTAAAGVQGPTPELRTYTQAERQWYPLDIANRLELLIVTLRPNPAYDYAANYAARRNLIKTAQQQLFVAVPGVPLGHIDSDSAQALRNHSHGTGTERWRSSNYQAGGRFMEGIYNHAWFARRALTQNEIESFANSFWKYYAA